MTRSFGEYLEQDNALRSLRPNARQIRNLISTANSLAQADGRKMEVDDLKLAVEMSSRFKKYMNAIMGVSEERMARRAGLRSDEVSEE